MLHVLHVLVCYVNVHHLLPTFYFMGLQSYVEVYSKNVGLVSDLVIYNKLPW